MEEIGMSREISGAVMLIGSFIGFTLVGFVISSMLVRAIKNKKVQELV